VATEGAGWSEFAQLVPNHGLGYEYWYVLTTVVNRDGVTQHGWNNHRTARPGLDYVLGVCLILLGDLLEKVVVNEWTLF
jgi:hypothetical protein